MEIPAIATAVTSSPVRFQARPRPGSSLEYFVPFLFHCRPRRPAVLSPGPPGRRSGSWRQTPGTRHTKPVSNSAQSQSLATPPAASRTKFKLFSSVAGGLEGAFYFSGTGYTLSHRLLSCAPSLRRRLHLVQHLPRMKWDDVMTSPHRPLLCMTQSGQQKGGGSSGQVHHQQTQRQVAWR